MCFLSEELHSLLLWSILANLQYRFRMSEVKSAIVSAASRCSTSNLHSSSSVRGQKEITVDAKGTWIMLDQLENYLLINVDCLLAIPTMKIKASKLRRTECYCSEAEYRKNTIEDCSRKRK